MSANKQDDTELLPDEYTNAFNEVAGASQSTSDDEAMGISTPALEEAVAKVEGEEEGAGTAQIEAGAGDAQPVAVQNEGGEAAVAGAPVEAVAPDEEAGMTAAQIQSKRTHEGRMRKMQEQLDTLSAQSKAKDDTAADQLAAVIAGQDAGADNAQAAADVVEQLQAGSLSSDEAMKQLTEDFGEDFVKMISVVVASKAAEIASKATADGMSKVGAEVKEITSQIADVNERLHFEAICKAVPDFFEQTKTPEFAKFAEAADEETKSVISGGDAKRVIAMMKKFKASQTPEAPAIQVEDPALAAAEGVRSGSRLPDKPAAASKDDFEGSWAEASKT